jgi:hypothetical protein
VKPALSGEIKETVTVKPPVITTKPRVISSLLINTDPNLPCVKYSSALTVACTCCEKGG